MTYFPIHARIHAEYRHTSGILPIPGNFMFKLVVTFLFCHVPAPSSARNASVPGGIFCDFGLSPAMEIKLCGKVIWHNSFNQF